MPMSKVAVAALATALLAGVAGPGCKSDKPRDTPETLAKLADCTAQAGKLADKDRLIESYEGEIARLKLAAGGTSVQYTFVLDGDAWAMKSKTSGGSGTGRPIDDKTADVLANEFIDLVGRSRPPVQKCYEQALKKNAALQARTVRLQVSATFGANGGFSKASFSPDLGDAFDGCMRAVAGKWKLTASGSPATFQATVTLSPS
ncbi:MAG TPA: hypothetical protein VHE35_15095 [Kofleriaceae bacterium]|nr:hypothetical protein [Kofleriaceae bacterium]